MWCAECGMPMDRRRDGAWHGCCQRLGYWSREQPLAGDRWWPVTKLDDFYFYPTGKWPKDRKPTRPNQYHLAKDAMANLCGGRW